MALIASKGPYDKGLRDFGNGCYAWLQPDGSWGWSNAGLIADGGESMLVDTLFDLRLTREMLDGMRRAEPEATANIGSLVNTHSNGDHTFGNQLVAGAEIIASKACAEEMQHEGGARRLVEMKRHVDTSTRAGKFLAEIFAPFEFEGIDVPMPTLTFEGELIRRVGGKNVRLIQVGPAHTRGDVLVFVPEDRTLFTGDMLFINGHPIIWAGPVGNWIKACELMLDLDVETVVPGHGPVTDKHGIRAVKDFFEALQGEARRRYDAGMTAEQAARDIRLGDYSDWGDAERIAVNVATLYREFAGGQPVSDIRPDLFALMADLRAAQPA